MVAEAVVRFQAETPGGQVPDLARAAFALALPEHPDLDLEAEVGRLDSLAARLRPRLGGGQRADLEALRAVLWGELGLRGNVDDYSDPRNSYLHEVLTRRLGLPITLALVALEVASRVGLPLRGVGFPGHFLLRNDGPAGTLVLDPFDAGRELDAAALEGLRRTYAGPGAPPAQALLGPASSREILARMLRNLTRAHIGRGELHHARLDLDRLLHIEPAARDALHDRGVVQIELGAYAEAARDLETWLSRYPDAPGAQEVAGRLEEARLRLVRTLN